MASSNDLAAGPTPTEEIKLLAKDTMESHLTCPCHHLHHVEPLAVSSSGLKRRLLLALPPATARDVLGEAVLPERLVACGEPAFDENATLWSLSVPDPVARLGYAVREAAFDPERVFTPEEAALIHEALSELGA
jgi:hypothetical protein